MHRTEVQNSSSGLYVKHSRRETNGQTKSTQTKLYKTLNSGQIRVLVARCCLCLRSPSLRDEEVAALLELELEDEELPELEYEELPELEEACCWKASPKDEPFWW